MFASMRRAPLGACVALASTAFASDCAAQGRDVQLRMGGSFGWDVGYVAVAGAMLGGAYLFEPQIVDRAPLDGAGARVWRPGVSTVTDVVLWGGLGAAVGLGVAVERWGRGERGATLLRAPLVMAESALLALGVVALLKNAVGECRPRAWSDATGTCTSAELEDRRSFPSGHTAPLAAMAGASLGMMVFPTGGRRAYWPLVATATTLAATNLVLRVVAGAHNWVDTSVGFATGFGVGLGTAALHTYALPVTVGASAQGVSVAGVF
jgi:membrane-associated phospholipid phosphatase